MSTEIRHPKRLRQAVDWTSHSMGKDSRITASDVDYFFSFNWGQYLVLGDFKHKNYVDKCIGKYNFYRPLIDAYNDDPEKRAIYMTIEHETKATDLINIEDCIVREVYFTKGHNYIVPRDRQLRVRTVENAFGFCYDIKEIKESPFYEVDFDLIHNYNFL